ncbi:leucine-rich repeat domain-containing protein [Trichocoleus sp. FACHB-262]|uniref:leucine-rich repeat domain-containing protein n=1 Tax=Trichocoleus sp. FACHB-262 TaxID=2692869 RepID=UPI0016835D61|nr:leucine-rich repeat domain-containing protein [Trichocoleus sp. FACHB-262]MBD2123982.1 leucine-rich repeat domain-containing protein [Trichocoleus sp. FACHB-262]
MTREELLALIDQTAEESWKELDLSGKKLTELPGEIGKLTQLETLILGKWEREKKGSQGREGFEYVEGKWVPLVSGNQLKSLPPELANLNNLCMLDLSGNHFEEFPDVVAQLPALEQLTLTWGELKELPKTIGQLTNLTTLHLFENQLTQVPEAIGQLTNLTTLHLSNNQLTQVPEAIGQLTNLSALHLSALLKE